MVKPASAVNEDPIVANDVPGSLPLPIRPRWQHRDVGLTQELRQLADEVLAGGAAMRRYSGEPTSREPAPGHLGSLPTAAREIAALLKRPR